ncbi:MAG: alpha-galactosidase [Muribaculaceae bacterium]|nr:alpha-galactosidase [Muribaculaceae bacterium]
MKRLLFTAIAVASVIALWAIETLTMGWSSWNTYRVDISADLICRQADAMAQSGLGDAGYRYINIDDGFFGGRDSSGNLLVHPHRFPDGLRPVVDHIHALGFKAGIYSDAGRNTCGSFWDNDSAGIGVGFYGHDANDAKLYFHDLGFDFIKIDFCGGDANQNFGHIDLDERARYTAIREAIDAVGRNDVRINVCRWAFPGTWVRNIGSSWRIDSDISPHWSAIKRIIAANNYLSAYAGQGHYNDMDMLEIGRGLSDAEERTHFGMWCVMSSPLLIGCDLTSIPEQSLRLISNPELIAVNQDSLGLQAHVLRTDTLSGITLYVKDVHTLHGLTRVAAIYNPSDSMGAFTVRPDELSLGGKVEVRDLLARRDLEPIAPGQELEITLLPHDTSIVLLTAQERLEQTVYEAETAWLERFQMLGINPLLGHAEYVEDASCSGGAKVSHIGHNPDNWMEWRDVYSFEGGPYELSIDFIPESECRVIITVNGDEQQSILLPAAQLPSDKTCSAKTKITLAPGSNTIRLGSGAAWAPDIDCIRLNRLDICVQEVESPQRPQKRD